MRIFYHVSWRRNSGAGGNCDSSTISSDTLIGGGSLACQYGCSGTISQMSYYCTDYSAEEGWSFGERQLTQLYRAKYKYNHNRFYRMLLDYWW